MFRDGPILTGGSYRELQRVFSIFFVFLNVTQSIFTCFGGADEQSSTPRARFCHCLQKKVMFFGGSCNGSDGGVGGDGWVGG